MPVQHTALAPFNHLMARLLPAVPKPWVWPFAKTYVAGETLDEMVETVQDLNARGMCCTVDLLGEFVTTRDEARQAMESYLKVLQLIAERQLDTNISVKPTQLGLLLDQDLCYEHFKTLVAEAHRLGNFVRLDMEDRHCTQATIALYLKLRASFDNVGIVIQGYLRRSETDIAHLQESVKNLRAEAASPQQPLNIRLCKGIYREPREVAFHDRELIQKNYGMLLRQMLPAGADSPNRAYVGIATHDETLVWEAEQWIKTAGIEKNAYEFQMLLGVDPVLRQLILEKGHKLRIYVPFGHEWHAYSLRRFRENPVLVQYILSNLIQRLLRNWKNAR